MNSSKICPVDGLKSQMKMHYRLLCDIMAKSISVKAGSFNAITVEKFSLLTAVVCDVKMNWGSVLFGILKKMKPPPLLSTYAAAAARLRRKIVSGQFDEENPFVLISSVLLVQADEGVSFLVVDRIGDIYHNLPRRADVLVTTVGARHKCQQDTVINQVLQQMDSISADQCDTSIVEGAESLGVGTAGGVQQVKFSEEKLVEKSVDAFISVYETMSLDDILYSIPEEVSLPSTGVEVTNISFRKEIKIPGVTEFTWHLAGLPKIPANHKGKEPLIDKNPIKGNPVMEQVTLILADID
ncbi:hypothetical protein F511_33383 [Dorcoceras hygrometricum]|uniref:Uncharacterized protein n=1 Tax=Dorcoceras hygrometricum TaxID=472368 RepID=A0A2Z7BNC8_9LAMI|nr:hypothetical protein F511_33383 [Dorcoceras hygrometricum]